MKATMRINICRLSYATILVVVISFLFISVKNVRAQIEVDWMYFPSSPPSGSIFNIGNIGNVQINYTGPGGLNWRSLISGNDGVPVAGYNWDTNSSEVLFKYSSNTQSVTFTFLDGPIDASLLYVNVGSLMQNNGSIIRVNNPTGDISFTSLGDTGWGSARVVWDSTGPTDGFFENDDSFNSNTAGELFRASGDSISSLTFQGLSTNDGYTFSIGSFVPEPSSSLLIIASMLFPLLYRKRNNIL